VAPDTDGTPRQAADKLEEFMASGQGGSGYNVGKPGVLRAQNHTRRAPGVLTQPILPASEKERPCIPRLKHFFRK
jgi:hypothetical protein